MVINKINHLKQICAIYIYDEDKNILDSYPLISTVSNGNHLANQITMVAKHLGALPIIDGSIANIVNFHGEDMRLEVHENTFNALLNSVEELKFTANNETMNDSNNNAGTKNKQTNITWAAEFVISNINISLKESVTDTFTNTVNITFTATDKAILTSITIPLYITSCETKPGLSKTSSLKGDAVITFNSEKNIFEFKIVKAIVASIDFVVFELKDVDVVEYVPPRSLPGLINFSREIPTADGLKTTDVSIIDCKMRSQNKRIILSLKLAYRTSPKKAIS
jgi:hypothetical protein